MEIILMLSQSRLSGYLLFMRLVLKVGLCPDFIHMSGFQHKTVDTGTIFFMVYMKIFTYTSVKYYYLTAEIYIDEQY